MAQRYDVVVVGGGPAGLSGALALARSRRSVLVVDAGEPRNAPAAHAHNFLTRDGVPPLELLAAGRAEVASYGGELREGRAVSAERTDDGFTVTLADGGQVSARRLLVTTGLVDELPDVPGLRERWGRDVLHCPYCHGWEVRDQAVGVLATSPAVGHQAQLFRQLTADVTVFTHTGPELPDQLWEEFAARGIAVVEGEVAGLQVDGDALTGVRLASGQVVPVQALVVAPRFTARSALLESLGLTAEPVEMAGAVIGSAVPAAERTGATAVPGVFVAGNVTDLGAQVVSSASAGLLSGAFINADLVAEETRQAVAARAVAVAR
ncbi:NAD(P)/FAD-dependent oxidoreductase [Modestobacter sp. NPDC049651]|uniref:NAD(P)/FAD-dependent oxidoreductase n=1 Tax=unclassified Modestobacter TaxID=2643866 RepID=UPI003401C7CF